MDNKLINKVSRLTDSLEELSESYDLYILFIDLCDSTEIKQFCLDSDIPDSIWIMRLKVFLSRTSKIIQQYSGAIIKTIGDEVMATFKVDTDPMTIFKCVFEVFQTFENLKSYNKGRFKIESKASIDFGTCYDGQLIKPGLIDPIGSCVDRCARMGKYAGRNEVVFSDDLLEIMKERKIDLKKYTIESEKEEMKGLGIIQFHKILTSEDA
jgi:class 3 adenylate cyclase